MFVPQEESRVETVCTGVPYTVPHVLSILSRPLDLCLSTCMLTLLSKLMKKMINIYHVFHGLG